MKWEYIGEESIRDRGVFCLRDGEKTLFQSYTMAYAADGRSIDTRRSLLSEKQENGEEIILCGG